MAFLSLCDNGEVCLYEKWKTDERFKAWIAADPTSKTIAMCVGCNKAIDISRMGESTLQSHMIAQTLISQRVIKDHLQNVGRVAKLKTSLSGQIMQDRE